MIIFVEFQTNSNCRAIEIIWRSEIMLFLFEVNLSHLLNSRLYLKNLLNFMGFFEECQIPNWSPATSATIPPVQNLEIVLYFFDSKWEIKSFSAWLLISSKFPPAATPFLPVCLHFSWADRKSADVSWPLEKTKQKFKFNEKSKSWEQSPNISLSTLEKIKKNRDITNLGSVFDLLA